MENRKINYIVREAEYIKQQIELFEEFGAEEMRIMANEDIPTNFAYNIDLLYLRARDGKFYFNDNMGYLRNSDNIHANQEHIIFNYEANLETTVIDDLQDINVDYFREIKDKIVFDIPNLQCMSCRNDTDLRKKNELIDFCSEVLDELNFYKFEVEVIYTMFLHELRLYFNEYIIPRYKSEAECIEVMDIGHRKRLSKKHIHIVSGAVKDAINESILPQLKNQLLLLKDIINQSHNPQKLVNILTNFRRDTPIKYTTHLWDMNFSKEYGSFDGYINKVKEQWEEIEIDLKYLSPNLHQKIYDFLFNDSNKAQNWCSKEGDSLSIGWSSLQGLRAWCDEGNDPFAFCLSQSYQIENKTLSTFGGAIGLFKQEIQIRNENNILESIFIDIEERLDDELEGVFKIETIKLKGKSFYTDVEVFQNVLDRIFSEIKKRQEFPKIRVECVEDEQGEYIELHITQIGSYANRSKEEMLNIANGGDSDEIKKSLQNLCDWSIESSYEGEHYRINYLKSSDSQEVEVLDSKPDGFTHIMRFYR
ncbi:MAG: hypothetical protein JXQ76_04120 [Campylobacterales bacterium]|nr:hypothetical protein [Campylobacterales bacterium]